MNYYLFSLDYLHGILMEIPVVLSEMGAARFILTYPEFHGQHLGVNRLDCDEQMQPAIVSRPAGTGDVLFMFFQEPVSLGLRTRIIETPPNTLMRWGQGSAHYYGNANVPWRHSWMNGAKLRSLIVGDAAAIISISY
jgi:hypothetical protein